jgi:hypothetical protein
MAETLILKMHVTTHAVPQVSLLEEWCLLLTARSDLIGESLERELMIVVAVYVGQKNVQSSMRCAAFHMLGKMVSITGN